MRYLSLVIPDGEGTVSFDARLNGRDVLKQYYVYIMANVARTLYVGVTNDLSRRVYEHKQKLVPGFTSKYNLARLVYFETSGDARAAIAREKQIKGWLRAKKIALIEASNPEWEDLSARWYDDDLPSGPSQTGTKDSE